MEEEGVDAVTGMYEAEPLNGGFFPAYYAYLKYHAFVSAPTSCGLGACASTGLTSCVAGVVLDSCTAGTPASSDTTCNGIDDN